MEKLIDENKLLTVLETIDEYVATVLEDCKDNQISSTYCNGYTDACNDCAKLIRDILDEPTTSTIHTLTEKEFQDYCAYKLIEKDIKGCMDRERNLETELDKYRNRYGEL